MRGLIILSLTLCGFLPMSAIAAHFEEGSLDRLFNTAAERKKIDAFRKGKSLSVTREQISPTDVKIQGIVKRSNGKNTVWVNGKSTLESNLVGGVNVKLNSLNNKSNEVSVEVNNKTVRLKAGEVWSKDSGQISESY